MGGTEYRWYCHRGRVDKKGRAVKKPILIALLGLLLFAGCGGDSEATDAANKASAAAEAAAAQVSALQDELDARDAEIATAKKKAKKIKAKKVAAKKKARAKQQAVAVAAAEPVEEPAGAPDVTGLTLTAAKAALRDAGFRADPTNTDTMFGIVNPDNYTVCTQDAPRGNIVPMLAQKYGC